MDQTGAPDKRLPPVQWPFKQDSSSVHVTSNILLDTVHQSLCTMHSPVCISGNVLIHTLYTNLSVQPMHSLTCRYLRQRSHTHSVHQSLCTTHAFTHLLVSQATSSYTLCTPISLYNPCTHSPVGISGNILIHTLYTDLQPSAAILQHVTGTTNNHNQSACVQERVTIVNSVLLYTLCIP